MLTGRYVARQEDWEVRPCMAPRKKGVCFHLCLSVHARLLHLLQKVCAAETGSAQLQAVLGCFFKLSKSCSV